MVWGVELGEAERGVVLFFVCAREERWFLFWGRGEDWFIRGLTLRVVNKRRLGLWSFCFLRVFIFESARVFVLFSFYRRNVVGFRICVRRSERG